MNESLLCPFLQYPFEYSYSLLYNICFRIKLIKSNKTY